MAYTDDLPDGIPATVYTRDAAAETLRLAERTVSLAGKKLDANPADE